MRIVGDVLLGRFYRRAKTSVFSPRAGTGCIMAIDIPSGTTRWERRSDSFNTPGDFVIAPSENLVHVLGEIAHRSHGFALTFLSFTPDLFEPRPPLWVPTQEKIELARHFD